MLIIDSMKQKSTIFLLVILIAISNLALRSKTVTPLFTPKQKLSEYNFFIGKISDLKPADGIIPYDLNTPLFSNYAEKLRFIKLPAGIKTTYTENGSLDFPK